MEARQAWRYQKQVNIMFALQIDTGVFDNSLTKDSSPIYVSGRRTAWKERLLKTLCHFCGCFFVTEKSTNTKATNYFLVGRKNNMLLVHSLWDYFSEHIHSLATSKFIGAGRIIINSYCLGYVNGLETKSVSVNSIKLEQEAKHFAHLTHYTVEDIVDCSNYNINMEIFQRGYNASSIIELGKINSQSIASSVDC